MTRSLRFTLLLTTVFAAARLAAAEPAELTSLRAKAEKGNALAQYNLGLAYAQGQQVSADLPQAFMWLSLASENGSTGKALETVLGDINDEQLAEGRRLLTANRAAYAPRVATPTMSRSTFRKLSNRGFSLNGSAAAPAVKAPEVTRSIESVSTETNEINQVKYENAQLKADLVRAENQIREQAESIARLQEQLAGKLQAVVNVAPNHRSTSEGLVAGGPLH